MSSPVTWVWVSGTVPVRPEASRSLKSDSPSQPSERQKRITVGWLTPAARAISAMGSLSAERGCASTWSATRRSAGERLARRGGSGRGWSTPGLPCSPRSCAARIAEAPTKVACSAVMTKVGIAAHVVAEAALLLEARAEPGAVEVLAQPRHDAAADEDAAHRAQRHRQVGRRRAEHGAEGFQRLDAERVAAVPGARCVISGAAAPAAWRRRAAPSARWISSMPGPDSRRSNETCEYGLQRVAQDRDLALVARRKAGVAAFGAERHLAVADRDQPRHPRPRPAPSRPITLRGARLAAADLAHLRAAQARQRHRQRGEVVDHHQRLQAQPLAHLLDRELPVVVGHPHLVAFDRVGDGHRRRAAAIRRGTAAR